VQYLGLVGWIIGIAGFVFWGQTFKKKNYDIMALRPKFFLFSGLLVLFSIGSLYTNGLNKGLDFTGGTRIEAGVYQLLTVSDVRQAMEKFQSENFKLGSVQVKTGTGMVTDQMPEEGKPSEFQRVNLRLVTEAGSQLEPAQTREVLDHLATELGDIKELSTASIGPTISGELTTNAVKAVVLALALQLIYIFFRFGNQIRYGLAANVALVHDVIVMLGFYSLAGKEIDSPFVAAALTVVGYSVMDSVVIFDRIRENLNDWWLDNGEDEDAPYETIVNDSVNQTMIRSINTTLTTLITLLAIYYFGGSTLQNFAFALLIGILAGAYSSICIASPLLVTINGKYPVKPYQAISWGSVDDEVVPEDFLEDDESEAPSRQKPKKRKKVESPQLVDDSQPQGGGRRRSRGKRS
jgi:preprotein translocase subunit SecF